MSCNINVKLLHESFHSDQTGKVHARGYATLNGVMTTGTALAGSVLECDSGGALRQWLSRVNGFFAVVATLDHGFFAAVDRVRSIPLFYGQRDGALYLSDDAHWVAEQIGASEYSEPYLWEFVATGYVTGADTLASGVKQLRAGEVLTAVEGSSGVEVGTDRYFIYAHQRYVTGSEEDLLEELDAVMLRVFHRLLERADGRPLVVPLSGGLDSRLIVLMAKRLRYDRVITFSYGRNGNNESLVSKRIADELGVPWHFVSYSPEAWDTWWRSPERVRYMQFSSALTSLGHIQDWPAVWQLLRQGDLPQDSVFVPGHSADMPAGSRSKGKGHLYRLGTIDRSVVEKDILDYHYSLWDWAARHEEFEPIFLERIRDTLHDFPWSSVHEGASPFESFDWQERQAKFIINSVRCYEFWGYDWWLPFWDSDFTDFWCRVPVQYRVRKRLYDTYVGRIQADVMGHVVHTVSSSPTRRLRSAGIRLLQSAGLYSAAMALRARFRKHTEYTTHPLGWYGIIPYDQFRRLYTGKETINSFLAAEQVGKFFI